MVIENMAWRVVGPHAVEVPLDYHLAPVHDQEGVGVGPVEHLVEGPHLAVVTLDEEAVEIQAGVGRCGPGEFPDWSPTAFNAGRRT